MQAKQSKRKQRRERKVHADWILLRKILKAAQEEKCYSTQINADKKEFTQIESEARSIKNKRIGSRLTLLTF